MGLSGNLERRGEDAPIGIHSANLSIGLRNHREDLPDQSAVRRAGHWLRQTLAHLLLATSPGHTWFSSIMQNQVTVNLGHQILSGNLDPSTFFHHQFTETDITVNFLQRTATDRAGRHKRILQIDD